MKSDSTSSTFASGKLRRQKGAALVEYAFIAILFLSLLFGISGFGHALYVYHHLNEAAKEATRYAAVRGLNCSVDSSCVASNSASGTAGPTTQSDVQAYVLSITPPAIDTSQLTTTATWPGPDSPPICFHDITVPSGVVVTKVPNNSPGCTVQVQIQYVYTFMFPLVQSTSTTMSSSSEMVILH
jgi:Flp pilus assembly protein TadG